MADGHDGAHLDYPAILCFLTHVVESNNIFHYNLSIINEVGMNPVGNNLRGFEAKSLKDEIFNEIEDCIYLIEQNYRIPEHVEDDIRIFNDKIKFAVTAAITSDAIFEKFKFRLSQLPEEIRMKMNVCDTAKLQNEFMGMLNDVYGD